MLETASATQDFFQNLNKAEGLLPVLVHGGGVQVATLLNKLGYETKKKDGLRISPADQMPYVAGSLAGAVNKTLVAQANLAGFKAVGISALDGNSISAEQIDPELGSVGQPTGYDSSLLTQLVSHGWLPVMSSIGASAQGELLNINADHAAATVAEGLKCPLVLLSDVPSVLDLDKQRIPTISPDNLPALVNEQVITDGMLVKVNAAMDTAVKTKEPVIIAGWRDNLTTILAGDAGTHILPE